VQLQNPLLLGFIAATQFASATVIPVSSTHTTLRDCELEEQVPHAPALHW
jgi:hypothetical protein